MDAQEGNHIVFRVEINESGVLKQGASEPIEITRPTRRDWQPHERTEASELVERRAILLKVTRRAHLPPASRAAPPTAADWFAYEATLQPICGRAERGRRRAAGCGCARPTRRCNSGALIARKATRTPFFRERMTRRRLLTVSRKERGEPNGQDWRGLIRWRTKKPRCALTLVAPALRRRRRRIPTVLSAGGGRSAGGARLVVAALGIRAAARKFRACSGRSGRIAIAGRDVDRAGARSSART
jgi:hypothetical protein